MVLVEVIQGPDKGRVFQVGDGDAVIGRQSESFPLSDGTVSRRHARLVERDRVWMIEDAGSVNGTFLNGVRVNKSARLHLGDQIRCGTTLLVFGGSGGKQAAPTMDEGKFLDAAIMAQVPANDESVVIPTPEAGAEAIGNLRILYNLMTESASVFNVDQLMQRTLDKICDVVPADRAYILLIGEDDQIIPKASRVKTESDPDQIPISRTIINEVIRNQVGVLSSNAMRDKRFSRGKSVHAFGIRSALIAPIKGREKVLGVIHVDSSVAEQTYSTEQLRLLTAIGCQTGLALENVRLYESAVKSERLAAVGETVALLSHHIKNILQALGGGTEVVEMALRQSDLVKANKAWPIVRRNLDRVNNVILNMLAYSTARKPLMETVNINYILNECVETITAQIDEKHVALVTDFADLPPIPADASGLNQAVLNLLTNALDAVAPKTGKITLSSSFDTMNRRVIIKVSDNGVGIEPAELKKIWEPFHSTKGQKGSGLGLAVTGKVVEEQRGKIDVQSEVGKGTTFTIRLPATPVSTASGDTLRR